MLMAACPLTAREMPSRVHDASPEQWLTLRSSDAPQLHVKIAPTGKQLFEAAQNASFAEGTALPLAKMLGIKPPPNPAAPRRLGSVFPSNAAGQFVQWQELNDHSYVTHIRVTSVGAKGVRAKLQLPTGMTTGELRAAARPGDIAESIPLDIAVNGEIWTPYTDGESQIVEIHLPRRVEAAVRVADIVHFEESLNASDGPGVPGVNAAIAGSCNPDVVCTANDSLLDAAIAERRRSVARMVFQTINGAFSCTGTLINSDSRQNFFLTANHCISTQAEAASLIVRWFYEAATCGAGASSVSPNVVNQSGGAQLMFTNQFVDSTLLKLNQAPPSGTVFSGWNAAPLAPNTPMVAISHPQSDVMKFALGTISSLQGNDGLIRLEGYEQEMYGVLFNRGVIESGSSGSGLFVLSGGSLQLRGVLSSSTIRAGGGLSCSNINENANYGRFDYFYPQIAPLLNGQNYPPDDYPNQPSATGPVLIPGASLSGQLSYVGDIDVFQIPVSQSGTLFVKSAGGYDLIGNLMNSSGTTVQTNDDNFDATNLVGNDEFGISWQVSPGTYYLAVAAWEPSLTTTTPYTISSSFTTAVTNHTSMWWAGDAESGWGLNLNHQGNIIFGAMFNYEAAGLGTQNPGMWLVATMTKAAETESFSGQLLRVQGRAFNAPPTNPAIFSSTQVGNMRVAFSGENTGTLTYDVAGAGTGGTGATITKNITRQVFATPPVCKFSGSDRSFATNYQDLWWNPLESGWGIGLAHQSNIVFATLYTYEAGGGTLNKGMWLTATLSRATGTRTFQGDLLRVTGSAFNASPFIPLNAATNTRRVGNMRIEFSHGNAAELTYDVDGQQVVKTIERQVFDTFRPECEAP